MSEPKYKKGDKVHIRYHSAFWPNCVITIDTISPNHGGDGHHRYWGMTDSGSSAGAYENQIIGIVKR